MKFVYPVIDNVFDTECGEVNSIIIENQKLLRELLTDLSNQMEGMDGLSVLSVSNKELPVSKYIEVLDRFIPFEINTRVLQGKLAASLERYAVEAYFEDTMKLLNSIENYLDDISLGVTGDVDFQRVNIGAVIKAVVPAFCNEYSSLGEKLLDYFELVRAYDKDKLFILVNARSYLSDDEAASFIDSVLRHGFHVVLIDNVEYSKLPGERRFIIDRDLCGIMG